MRIFFDTEFLDTGEMPQLISLGAVRDDGQEFYAENAEFDWSKATPWLIANVKPHTLGYGIPLKEMRAGFQEFASLIPEFWAKFGTYDWFLVMHMMGGFWNLPSTWPQYFNEFQTLKLLRDIRVWSSPVKQRRVHHALDDALTLRDEFNYLLPGD